MRSGIVSDLARYLNRAVPAAASPSPPGQQAPTVSAPGFPHDSDTGPCRAAADSPQSSSQPGRPAEGIPYIPADGSAISVRLAAQRGLSCRQLHHAPEQARGEGGRGELVAAAAVALQPVGAAARFMDLEGEAELEREVAEAKRQARQERAGEVDRLRRLRMRGTVQCLACMGEYQECLGPLLAERIVEVVLALLVDWRPFPVELVDVLRLQCSLLAHRRLWRRSFIPSFQSTQQEGSAAALCH